MKKIIKSIIVKLKIYGLKKFIYFGFCEINLLFFHRLIKKSFSQYWEDLAIDKMLDYKKFGFYVDVGAHNPKRFNNTQRFYLKGWRGINIEPNYINFKKFLIDRPNDINLNIGIGNINNEMDFYIFEPDTTCTFSKDMAKLK